MLLVPRPDGFTFPGDSPRVKQCRVTVRAQSGKEAVSLFMAAGFYTTQPLFGLYAVPAVGSVAEAANNQPGVVFVQSPVQPGPPVPCLPAVGGMPVIVKETP